MRSTGTLAPPVRPLPSCSVVVCTRDRPDELDRCLASLGTLDLAPMEVIVVDSGPARWPAQSVAQSRGARYVLERRRGLGRARNVGARIASGDVVAYLDDDSIAEPGWLRALAVEFEDPAVAVVTGRCAPMDDQGSEAMRDVMRSWWPNGAGRFALDRSVDGWARMAIAGSVGTGGNMALRRIVFSTWTGFDERLGRGAPIDSGEEHHAFFELLRRGYAIAYNPHSVVRHPVPETVESYRRHALRSRAAYVAGLLLLFTEQPESRHAIRQLTRGHLQGDRAASGSVAQSPSAGGVATTMEAVIRGIGKYVFSLVRRR
jgi:glycosyltransferase involved in cell wall biosynthesis